jgi:putative ABC transport system permease protein
MLLKQPAFTLIAMLTLALGIGATSAVLSLIEGVLLTSPYPHPQRLVLIPSARTDGRQVAHPRGWAARQWMEWQQEAKSFEAIAAYSWAFNFLVLQEGSESMEGMWVTPDYFRVVGIHPVLGRSFLAAETGANAAPVIILGYEFWQRRFSGDPKIIGQTIHISRQDTPPKIIGVMPPGVRFLPSSGASQEPNYNVNALVDFWRPAAPDPARLKDPSWDVVGRLQCGVALPQAQAELAVISARQAQADRDFEGITPRLQSLTSELNRDGGRVLLPLLGAAALVLFIACGNAAALLLVRGLQRQQEYALRSALGVGRLALLRQVSTESLLLALCGGVVGIGLAFCIVKLFAVIGSRAIPRLDAVTTGWPMLAAGLACAVLAAFLAGLLPALRASRLDPISVLRSAGPNSSLGRGERRLLRGVTMIQTTFTLALLVGAGLLIRTMANLSNVRSGYNVAHILTMTVTAVRGDWSDFHRRALERVSTLPGVQRAAFAWGVPLTGNDWPGTVEIEGQPAPKNPSDEISLALRAVTSGYFRILGLEISDGRDFRASDDRNSPGVAVINQVLADRYFPHASPLGRKLWIFGRQNAPTQIIGVVNNGRTDDLTQPPGPEIYLSLWQARAFSKDLVVQTSVEPRSLIAAVQRELRLVDPVVAIENLKTLEQIRSDSQASRRFAMQLLVGFSLVGGVLTLVGIYGVLSLSVASRHRELAIRAAVGAGRRDIRNLIFTEGFQLIAGGLISGIAAALVLSRVLRSFLFGVLPSDPLTLIAVGLLFSSVALLACWVPARRAVKIDPVEALRYE